MLQTGNKLRTSRADSGFTLIELVLVMAILVAVLSMAGSSLTSFFKGRSLDAEGKRFLALTRFAQDRAISEGQPIHLWINAAERKYGVEIAPAYSKTDRGAKELELGKDLDIELTWPAGAAMQQEGRDLIFRFTPDGYMDENNPELVTIKEKNREGADYIYIALNRSRLYYEITTNQVYLARR